MDILQKVQKIISDYLEVEPEEVSPDIPIFQACRFARSAFGFSPNAYMYFGTKRKKINLFNILELVLILEEEFGIDIPDSEVHSRLKTVKELADSISSKLVVAAP